MKSVVAFNDDVDLKGHLNEVEKLGEMEVGETAREVADLLGARLMPVRDVRAALDELRADRPEVVFNLCEGVAGKPEWEMHFGLALEMLGIPFTGADPTAVGICGDKGLTKQLLKTGGLPVPEGWVWSAGDPARVLDIRKPVGGEVARAPRWIVKPLHEDAGIGIDAASVCASPEEVTKRVEHVTKTYRQPALVEEFIDGRELNQALFFGAGGIRILPPGEIVFAASLRAEERVVGWKAKWAEGSAEDAATVNRTPGVIDDTLRSDVSDVCSKAASLLSIGGYCRFDLRQRPSGELCIIDVNPNPDIGRGSGFRRALDAAGIPFKDFLGELMMAALSRRRP
jgi:D-alanine-D-alanine ligase